MSRGLNFKTKYPEKGFDKKSKSKKPPAPPPPFGSAVRLKKYKDHDHLKYEIFSSPDDGWRLNIFSKRTDKRIFTKCFDTVSEAYDCIKTFIDGFDIGYDESM